MTTTSTETTFRPNTAPRMFGADRERTWPGLDRVALVAADEPGRRARLTTMLGGLGCKVIAAANGLDLSDRLADAILDGSELGRPGIIVSDALLPSVTMVGLLSGIRQLWLDVPLLLLTRPEQAEVRARACEAGVAGIFIEPIDFAQLRELAKLLLDPIRGRDSSRAIRRVRTTLHGHVPSFHYDVSE